MAPPKKKEVEAKPPPTLKDKQEQKQELKKIADNGVTISKLKLKEVDPNVLNSTKVEDEPALPPQQVTNNSTQEETQSVKIKLDKIDPITGQRDISLPPDVIPTLEEQEGDIVSAIKKKAELENQLKEQLKNAPSDQEFNITIKKPRKKKKIVDVPAKPTMINPPEEPEPVKVNITSEKPGNRKSPRQKKNDTVGEFEIPVKVTIKNESTQPVAKKNASAPIKVKVANQTDSAYEFNVTTKKEEVPVHQVDSNGDVNVSVSNVTKALDSPISVNVSSLKPSPAPNVTVEPSEQPAAEKPSEPEADAVAPAPPS